MNNIELFDALSLLAKEKGIEPDLLLEKIRAAIVIAIKRDYPRSENINFDIDIAKGKFDVSITKDIVEEVEDDANQVTLEQAQTLSKSKRL
ncbi:MAG: transcription termination/antitermination protein NusA, partial [Oscillospiraceae bacterium]|nr:transcription termination/antitermination protein NusA [Oscillospiraceae bacterium]